MYKEKDKFDYIKINTQDISVVDFLITKEKKQELFEIGYKRTKKYFDEFFPEKRKFLYSKYEKLLEYLFSFQKQFNKTNTVNSYLKLCEMFMFLCEEKRYLDTRIYDKILAFKNNYSKNYSSHNFFGIKGALIFNKENLAKDLLEIIKLTTIKCEELKF
jgi:hypothetical protein